jgi:hypothetical protein
MAERIPLGWNIHLARILDLSVAQRMKSISSRAGDSGPSTASLWSYPWSGGLRKLIRHLTRKFLEPNVSLPRQMDRDWFMKRSGFSTC